MGRTVSISLSLTDDEEILLNRLADSCNISHEAALTTALRVGSRWDTFVYEKMAAMLWQMQKCSYEESKQLVDTYKQKVEDDWKEFKASKTCRENLEEHQDRELEPEQ